MTRQLFLFSGLLTILVLQSCATPPYQPPTPYRKQPVILQDNLPGTPEPTTVPTNPIIYDIRRQAELQVQKGQLTAAAQTLERGLRIAPKDGSLWSQLAFVRLQQQRYGQALSLASKSNSLAKGNSRLIRRNQMIIYKAQQAGQ